MMLNKVSRADFLLTLCAIVEYVLKFEDLITDKEQYGFRKVSYALFVSTMTIG